MQAYAVSYSKYLITASVVLYTFLSYLALMSKNPGKGAYGAMQRTCMVIFMVNAFLTMSILSGSFTRLVIGSAAAVILAGSAYVYRKAYPGANMRMYDNIIMLLGMGLVIISRINGTKAYKQGFIALLGLSFVLAFPLLRGRLERLRSFTYLYALAGIAALAGVYALGAITNGSKLSYSIGGITFQPSEFVKILFILFLAGALCERPSPGLIALLTAAAAAHVGILLLSRDLGSALIFYIIYISMLYLATGDLKYLIGGLVIGAAGAVACYMVFSHVRVRVEVFLDPWSSIDGNGYQITQSLFAISFGGLFGAGLMQGMPSSIPFVESDFIFSAIVEEMGIVTGVCLILICLNIFIDFMKLARRYTNQYFRLITFGTGIAYIFQTFLTIGGEVKFIPLTGVTLPLVSYGGSSVLATLMLFGVVGAIFILQAERLERFSERYEQEFGRQGMPQGVPQGAPQGAPANRWYQRQPQGRPQAAQANGQYQRQPQGRPQGAQMNGQYQGMPQGTSQGAPVNGQYQGMPQGTPQGAPVNGQYQGMPQDMQQGGQPQGAQTGSSDDDFYKDFAGVPIYDPSKDYENVDHFDV